MQIRLTWINTRRRKIIAFIIDFWLSVLIYNYTYFIYFNSYPNQLVSISIGSFWVISSYILGRYKKDINISLQSFLISILKVFALIIFGILIYAFINWLYSIIFFDELLIDQKDLLLKDIFIKSISKIGFLSLIIQSLISILNYKIYKKKKYGFFMVKSKTIKNFCEN